MDIEHFLIKNRVQTSFILEENGSLLCKWQKFRVSRTVTKEMQDDNITAILEFLEIFRIYYKDKGIVANNALRDSQGNTDFAVNKRKKHPSPTLQIQVFGNVQGVGLRPFVFAIATKLGLKGFVRNISYCTEIFVTEILNQTNNGVVNPSSVLPDVLTSSCADISSYVKLFSLYSRLEVFLFSLLFACQQDGNQYDLEREREVLLGYYASKSRDNMLMNLLKTYDFLTKDILQLKRASIHSFVIHKHECLLNFEYLSKNLLDRLMKDFSITESKIEKTYMMRYQMGVQSHAFNLSFPLDLGICKDCLQDMRNKNSRFYHYAFTACINCGARYSIMQSLPYDRQRTTMKNFALCEFCQQDYTNPINKRFHTEPISCNKCAISLQYYEAQMTDSLPLGYMIWHAKPTSNLTAISSLANTLMNNNIALYKGLGGFAFLANARDSKSLNLIRRIKSRKHKPFVIMAHHETLKNLAILNRQAEKVLHSLESPIILALKSKHYNLPNEVSNLATIGVMRPYSPALMLLFDCLPKDFVLIYTSANKKGEMIARDIGELDLAYILQHIKDFLSPYDYREELEANDTALTNTQDFHLQHSVESDSIKIAVLEYNREILHRLDDSIVLGFDLLESDVDSNLKSHSHSSLRENSPSILESHNVFHANLRKNIKSSSLLQNLGTLRSLRLARGFAPLHITAKNLSLAALSVGFGAMQKSSFAFGLEDSIAVSPYLGDLFSANNCLNFEKTFSFFESLYGKPEILITDKHTQYASTQIAQNIAKSYRASGKDVQVASIYHHHAHFNALLLESNQQEGLGVIFDGSGLGSDGSIWGGEFLVGNLKQVERKLFFKPFRILGGEKNIQDCQKLMLSYALENNLFEIVDYLQERFSQQEFYILQNMFEKGFNSPQTSSVGRLFDIAGFLLGLQHIDYEGQSGEIIASLAINFLESDVLDSLFDRNKAHIECNSKRDSFNGDYKHTRTDNAKSFYVTDRHNTLIKDKSSYCSLKTKVAHKAMILRFMKFTPYPYEIKQSGIDISYCFQEMFKDYLDGKDKGMIALRFIDTLAYCVRDSLRLLGSDYALFGGGVFANFVLCARVQQLLHSCDMMSFFPQIPCNDYSISLGQLGFASQL